MAVIQRARMEREYKKSVQEMMDEKMCRPGYRWHGEPLNKCLPAAVPSDYRSAEPSDPPNPPSTEGEPAPAPEMTPDQAVQAEKMARSAGKKR